jgi:C1A family cysteine protease
MKTTSKHVYGWIPQLPDQRDKIFKPTVVGALPPMVDLRPLFPAVYDQGQLGSCTGNGIACTHEFDQMKQKFPAPFTPSRLFIYYNERVIEHTVNSDSGANIRDGIKVINTEGVCPESIWPYNIAKFTKKPSSKAYAQAKLYESVKYQAVIQSLEQIKATLASGFPIVMGFSVYDSFETDEVAQTGIAPLPNIETENCLGGHCVVIGGYDNSLYNGQGGFINRNSWGSDWGMAGYFTVPYNYFTNPDLADDYWVIQVIK